MKRKLLATCGQQVEACSDYANPHDQSGMKNNRLKPFPATFDTAHININSVNAQLRSDENAYICRRAG
jgi:hypothetical protein